MAATADHPADVCVIGRANFDTGIGTAGFAAAEMFARSFNTCYLPTERHLRSQESITLPNGRPIAVCHDPESCSVFFFTDVLWNGADDYNNVLVPDHGLRLAHVNFDSDRLPARWVDLLNERFDGAVAPSRSMETVLRASGVRCPISLVPIALDMDRWLAEPGPFRVGPVVRFVSVGAFHPRKGTDLLVEAFAEAFGNSPEVSLRLHSNLAFGDTLTRIRAQVRNAGLSNVRVTFGHKPQAEADRLIKDGDVFVSCSGGEGYSIPPRQALAAGKALLISAEGGHLDLLGPRGVFPMAPSLRIPARYPEIDNGIFGERGLLQVGEIVEQLRAARSYARTPAYIRDVRARRERASAFTFSRLAVPYCELVDTSIRSFRRDEPPHPIATVPETARAVAVATLGPYCRRLQDPGRRVILAHDGGFFSVFNAFLSHLTWDLRNPECHMLLPDWDVGRMMRIRGYTRLLSFCYGRPGDGNIWSRLFEPPYGLPGALLDDEAFLWNRDAPLPEIVNGQREPYLTHVNAYHLYRSLDFPAIRAQYHRAFTQHVRLLPHLQARADELTGDFDGRFVIGAHVRHPSHAVEQPGGLVPRLEPYLTRVRELVARQGIPLESNEWGVFVATDQERVVTRFREEFGDRIFAYSGVRRTTSSEDARFELLSATERLEDGNQLQHLVAADPDAWNLSMAEEILCDAVAMARCSALLHVVSNVATAVAFMNPHLEMQLMLPEAPRVNRTVTLPDRRHARRPHRPAMSG